MMQDEEDVQFVSYWKAPLLLPSLYTPCATGSSYKAPFMGTGSCFL